MGEESGAGEEGPNGDDASGGDEPGFEDGSGGGGDALPTMDEEEPVFAGGPSGGLPGLEGQAGGSPGQPGTPGEGTGGQDGDGENGGGYGRENGVTGSVSATVGGIPGGVRGTMSTAEQVAILEGQLEDGMGEFDRMILEEQAEQRRAARERGETEPMQTASASDAVGGANGSEGEGEYGRQIPGSGGGYSTGGGMGGISTGGSMPSNTAKFPPPEDIPNGNNDDVVARQLREAAMRETDPAVRERLWTEYRKYKGIEQP